LDIRKKKKRKLSLFPEESGREMTQPMTFLSRRCMRLRLSPHRRPGPGNQSPTWARTRPGQSRPLNQIRRLSAVYGRTKLIGSHTRNPSAHISSLSSLLLHVIVQHGRATARRMASHRNAPLVGACAHRWVDGPPLSGSSTGPYLCVPSWSSSSGGSSRRNHFIPHGGDV
jgi:hypothetical protein